MKIPVTRNFSKLPEDQIGILVINKEGKTIFNPDYYFEPGLEKDKNGNWILKEISLVRRKKSNE